MYDVHQGDAFEWLRAMPAESVDLFLTDPPYQSLEKHRARGTTTRLKQSKGSSNEWFSVIGDDRMPELLREAYRVLRPDRHAYVFCDPDTLFVLRPAAQAAGFEFRRIIVWDKARAGMGYGYRRQTEFVIYLRKGNRQVADLGVSDLIRCPGIRGGYPTEKPVPLLETLIFQSTQRGELVIDPFMGSGSAGVAAIGLGCSFRGCDISPRSLALAQERLAEAEKNARGEINT